MLKWLIGDKPKKTPQKPQAQSKARPAKKDQTKPRQDQDLLLAQIRAIAADHPEQTSALLKSWLDKSPQ